MSDKQAASLAGGIAGAFIGSFAGATALGFSLGSALGGRLVGGPTQERSEPRPPEELQQQTTKYGDPIPIVYGSQRIGGNIIWLKNNERDIVENTNESGGKGGGPTVETTTFQVFATFAVSLTDGEIGGVRRIWFASDLVFDGSDDASAESIQSGLTSNKWTLYKGTNTQEVDPDIEADIGAGNTPAFRNTSYIKFKDIDLSPYGDAIPPVTVEVTPVSGSIPRLLHEVELPPTGNSQTVADSDLILYDQGVVRLNLSESGRTWLPGDKSDAFDWIFDQNGNFIFKEPNPFDAFFADRNSQVGKMVTPLGIAIWIAFGRDQSGENYRLSSFVIIPLTGEIREFKIIRSGSTGNPAEFPIGACVSSNQQELYLFDQDTPDPTYRVFNTSLEEIRRGTVKGVDFNITVAGAAITGNRPPFVNEDGSLLWIKNKDSGDQSLAVFELNVDGDYDFVGEVTLADSGETGVARGTNLYLFDDSGGNNNGVARAYTVQPGLSQNTELLGNIIQDISSRAGLSTSNIDVSELSGVEVRGYAIDKPGSAKETLGPLRQAFFFDITENGYSISFKPRGQNPVTTFTDEDLSAREEGNDQPPIIEETRQQAENVPRRVYIKGPDPNRNYEPNSQYAYRTTTESENDKRIQTPVVLTADEQAKMADVLLRESLYGQSELSASATIQVSDLLPGDVVTIDTSSYRGNARIINMDEGRPGLVQIKLIPELAEIYSSSSVGDTGNISNTVLSSPGPTRFEILDLPPLRDSDNNAGIYVAMGRILGGWQGAVFQRKNAGEWNNLRSSTISTPIGYTNNKLQAPATTLTWDYGSSVNVSILNGQLNSATKDDVLQGANAIAIETSEGWELTQYMNATLESDGTYTLDTFLRGRRGTERLVNKHSEGDAVVVLQRSSLKRVQLSLDEIGRKDPYRAVTIGQSSGSTEQFKYKGIGLKPFSPSKLTGVRQSNNDIELNCFRRVRYAGNWRDSQDVPLVESELKFEWDVIDSNDNVVRTLFSTTSSVTYTEQQQIDDFGSVQSNYKVSVYQISNEVGRGFPTTETVPNRG